MSAEESHVPSETTSTLEAAAPDISAGFVFVTCQSGAESAVKTEAERNWPTWRFAYSRPGFITFKLPEGHGLAADFKLGSVFARSWGFSLGPAHGASVAERAIAAWQLVGDRPIDELHVWHRRATDGDADEHDPTIDTVVAETARQLAAHVPAGRMPAVARFGEAAEPTPRGRMVLDCMVSDADEWWIGLHRANRPASRWPGGLRPMKLPPHAVSRAYLKMAEALRWSRLPIEPGQRAVELGCAPGGAAQVLLEHGLLVTGIDPAEVHPDVLAHPNFTHIRKRSKDVRRRDLQKMRWLIADLNAVPQYTLDTVEAIVTHPRVNIRGMLLTLKLTDWRLADELPAHLERVRSWGFADVRAGQLQSNRREVCVAACRKRRR